MAYTDRAQGGTATASSTYSTNVAGNAIDGDEPSVWAATNTGGVVDDWLRVDLGEAHEIVAYRLYQSPDAAQYKATAYVLEYSTDDSSWSTAHTISSEPAADDFNEITPASARYWRIRATAGGNAGWIVHTLQLLTRDRFTVVSEAGQERTYELLSGGSPPASWYASDFDDSGWAASVDPGAVSAPGTLQIPDCSAKVARNPHTGRPANTTHLFRRSLNNTGGAGGGRIRVGGDGTLVRIYVNGTLVASPGVSLQSLTEYTCSLLSGTNVLAIEMSNWDGGIYDEGWLVYSVETADLAGFAFRLVIS